MIIRVKFFASCRETVGMNMTEIEITDGGDTNMLMDIILQKYPDLTNQMCDISLAVNKTYIDEAVKLKDGDEVALLPPISGG